ncbi:MAG TPA: hypothetical protein VIU33_03045 [Nitrospiria bacterium]
MIDLKTIRRSCLIGGTAVLLITVFWAEGKAASEEEVCPGDAVVRVELNLSKKLKKQKKAIQKAFKDQEESFKPRVDFFPFIDPPMNIGIGRCVPAEQARFAIGKALEYNRGITMLIYQKTLPTNWIGIGYTKLPERTWVAVSADGLKQLQDPSLSTEAFHALYSDLSQIREQPGIFGMPPIPVNPEPETP